MKNSLYLDLPEPIWQVLNSIKENEPINKHERVTFIRPFGDEASLNSIFQKFAEENLIIYEDEKLTLTVKGSELHQGCIEKQELFRQKAMADITQQQYQDSIKPQKKICENVASSQ